MLIDKKYRLEPIVNPLENEKLQLMGFIEQKTISPSKFTTHKNLQKQFHKKSILHHVILKTKGELLIY